MYGRHSDCLTSQLSPFALLLIFKTLESCKITGLAVVYPYVCKNKSSRIKNVNFYSLFREKLIVCSSNFLVYVVVFFVAKEACVAF